jgi:GTP-binding protein
LGVAPLEDYRTLTIADIPGIIEGAAEGKGLGHDFLRHIERTKVLLFIVDLGDEDPLETVKLLEAELAQHSDVFATRPKFIAFNKADVTENRERFDELAASADEPFLISAATGEGVKQLLDKLWHDVKRVREEEEAALTFQEGDGGREYIYEPPYTIETEGNGFRINGKTALRAVRMTDFENEEAVRYLERRLHKMGLFKALKRLGAEDGQPVHIGEVELEYHPE